MACLTRNSKITQNLLKKGARTTIKNKYNQTPLAVAFFEYVNFKKFYSDELKALVKRKNRNSGNTQLHLAASLNLGSVSSEKFNEYITFLLDNGLSLYTCNKDKKRPLDIAREEYDALNKKWENEKTARQLHLSTLLHNLTQKNQHVISLLKKEFTLDTHDKYQFRLAHKEYANLQKEYDNECAKILTFTETLRHQLQQKTDILNCFLRLANAHAQSALLTHLLHKYDAYDAELPKDVRIYIARLYNTLK
jgi:hypothetical protein